jgi:serine protease AprX
MKKFISSFVVIALVVLLAPSFRPGKGKIGTQLSYLLDNSNENSFVVWVFFRDKGPNPEQYLSNPLSLVTQRSIDRRLKVKARESVVDIYDVPVYSEYVNAVALQTPTLRQQVKWFNAVSAEVTREQLMEIAGLSCVSHVELVERFKKNPDDVEFRKSDETSYNPPFNPLVDSLNYGMSFNQINQISVNLVHNESIFGQGVMVASLDDGFIRPTHQVFTTLPTNIVATYDFQFHVPCACRTTASHGTTTMSNVGGYMPGQLIGPAFKSAFIVARTEVDSFERPIEMDNWSAAAQWADSLGADVITSSLGYLDFDPGYPTYTWVDMNGNTLLVTNAADFAADRGIIVCNSAGNNGPNGSHNTLGAPADGDTVFTVGAVSSTGVVASFSSVGPTTDSPPRIKPDFMAMGVNNRIATTTSNSSYGSGSGTSYSCPLAAGVAALVLASNKSLTPFQIRAILRRTASNYAAPNNTYGWGILNAKLASDSARKLDNAPPVISHTQPFTTTSNMGVITMTSKITDNGIIRNRTLEAPRLYFRKSSDNGSTWTTYTPVNASYMNLDSFFFPITGTAAGWRVEYYFAAQDIALPNPLMATLPSGGSGINPPGTNAPPTRFMYVITLVGIEPVSGEIPKEFKLYNNYPNPFNPITVIKFDIPGNHISNTKLAIYDLLGREAAVLMKEELKPGKYQIAWDASAFSSGVYFYKIVSGEFSDIKKLIILK